jgi:hypothetical protein
VFSFLIAIPAPEAEATVQPSRIIPPAVECDPYTPPADATNYSFNMQGTVTNGTSSMRAYLYAATYVDVTNISGRSDEWGTLVEHGFAFGMSSTYIPTGFACVAQAEVTNNQFSFQNMQVKYKPVAPSGDFDTKGESLVGDDQVRFLVMVHDETGQRVDTWGQTQQCGSSGTCQASGSTTNNTQYLGQRDRTVAMTGSPTEVFVTTYVAFLMRRSMFSDNYNLTLTPENWHQNINPSNYAESDSATVYPTFLQCMLTANMDGYCTNSLGLYLASFMYDINGTQEYTDACDGCDASIQPPHKVGNSFPYSYAPNSTQNVTIDMAIDTNAPEAGQEVPAALKVGDTFTMASNLTCYNSKGVALQKSGTTYTVTARDYGTQIYCSADTIVDTSSNANTAWGYVATANRARLDTTNTVELCGGFRYDTDTFGEQNFYCNFKSGAADSAASKINKFYNATKYSYESQTNWSNAVTAGSLTNLNITFDHPPTTGVTSVASTSCTEVNGSACSSDSNFKYAYQWQRWNGSAWQTVGTSSSYTPVSEDWGDPDDTAYFGKMQVISTVTYGGTNAGAYTPATFTKPVNLTLGTGPSIPVSIKCVQSDANKAFYPSSSDYQCAFGDSLVVYPNSTLPAGWTAKIYEWNIQHDCMNETTLAHDCAWIFDTVQIDNATTDTLLLGEDEDWGTTANQGFWNNSQCDLALGEGVMYDAGGVFLSSGCILEPSVTFSKTGYEDTISSTSFGAAIVNTGPDEFEADNQLYPGAPPTDWTPAFDYGEGVDHPMIGVPVNLTGLFDGDISDVKQLQTVCTVTYIPATGASTVVVNKQDCSPNKGNLDYTPLAAHEGGTLQVDAYIVDELNCGVLITCSTYSSPNYSSLIPGYANLIKAATKTITSAVIGKGNPLPANTLQFDPTRSTAKVDYQLAVVTPLDDWTMDEDTCSITLSDGTDVTNAGNCTDADFSYTPTGADYNKSVTFSATYERPGYYPSVLSLTSKTKVQSGDQVTIPVTVTGLLQTGMYAKINGTMIQDWQLATCGVYRYIDGENDVKVHDCMTNKQYLIVPEDVSHPLELRSTYTKYGYNDSSGSFRTADVSLGDYPYPTDLEIVADVDTNDGSTIVRAGKEAFVYGLPDENETGWGSSMNWQVCETNCDAPNAAWQNIAGETEEIFVPNADYVGKYIRASAIATKTGYNTTSLYSLTYIVESAQSYDYDFEPAIAGTLSLGSVLTASNIPYSGDPNWSNIRYAWSYKDLGAADSTAQDITNETGRQLVLTGDLFEKVLRVRVTATNVSSDTDVVRNSAWTAAIGAGLPITFSSIIIGDAKVGETLSVSGLPAPETGWTSITYQWYTINSGTEVEIVGETDSEYTILPENLGLQIMVKVTANTGLSNYTPSIDEAYAGEDDAHPDGMLVTKGNVPEFTPIIVGQQYMGSWLSLRGILDTNMYTSTYVWQRCASSADCTLDSNWSEIGNATASTYATVNADVGFNVRAEIIASNTQYPDAYEEETAVTSPLLIQKAKAIAYKPLLLGNFTAGSIVTASGFPSVGSGWEITACTWRLYADSGLSNTVNGDVNSNNTGCTPYLITPSDVGKRLELTTDAQKTGLTDYYETSTQSSATSQVIISADFPVFTPVFAGSQKIGSELVLKGLPLTVPDVTFVYSWQSRATPTAPLEPISQPATDSIQLTPDLLHRYISATVQVQIPGYNDYTITIQTTSGVLAGDAIEFTPRIIGVAKVGEVLIVGDVPDASLGWALAYEFKDNTGTSLATSKTYTPKPADVDKTITVTVKATKESYNDSVSTSVPTASVALGDAIVFTPQISGLDENNEATVDSILSATDLPDDSTGWNVTYAWYTGCDPACSKILNSDDEDYVPVAADVDSEIYLGAVATLDGYEPSVPFSATPATIINADFIDYDFNITYDQTTIVSGEPGCTASIAQDCTITDGRHLNVSFAPELPTVNPPSIAYTWYIADNATDAGVQIQNQVTSTYFAQDSDAGKYIHAIATLTKAGYNAKIYESDRLYISENDTPEFIPEFTADSGTKLGETLTIDAESLPSWDLDQYTFQSVTWYLQIGNEQDVANDQYIERTTDYSFTLEDPEFVNKKIYAIVHETDPGIQAVSGVTESTGVITKGDIEGFTPIISNASPKVDDILEVLDLPTRPDTASDVVPDYTFAYSWKANGTEVGTAATYEIQGADVGKSITVAVTASRDGYNDKQILSAATSVVAAGSPINFEPYLIGEFMVNGELTIEGIVDGYTPSFSLETCTAPDDENTCSTYQPQPTFQDASFMLIADLAEQNIRIKVTLSRQYYEDSSAYTPISAKINASDVYEEYEPLIRGTVRVGNELESEITVADEVNIAYQWQVSDDNSLFSDIISASTATYTPLVADFGKYLRLQITLSQNGYESVTKQSASQQVALGIIKESPTLAYCYANASDEPNSVTYKVGVTLYPCGLPTNFADSVFNLTYNWHYQNSQDTLPNGTNPFRTPTPEDLGELINVDVTINAEGYESITLTASAENAITKGDAIDLGNVQFSTHAPKVAETVRVEGIPNPATTGWSTVYQFGTCSSGDNCAIFTPVETTDTQNAPYSFLIPPEMLGKKLAVKLTVTKNGYNDAAKILEEDSATIIGDPISFLPVIHPVDSAILDKQPRVRDVLEIHGVPKPGDASLPFKTFTVDYKWYVSNDETQILGTDSTLVLTPAMQNLQIQSSVTISAVGFTDSIGVAEPVSVLSGARIQFTPIISGTLEAGQYVNVKGLPDEAEGWTLEQVTWYACQDSSDDISNCQTLSNSVDIDEYSQNPPRQKLTISEANKFIKVHVKFTKQGYIDADATATSARVALAPPPTFNPELTGGNRVGDQLTVIGTPASSEWTTDYQWLENGNPISSQTSKDFVLTALQAGKNVSVRVTISNSAPEYEGITSVMTSDAKNVLLGNALDVATGFAPFIASEKTLNGTQYYSLYGIPATSMGWSKKVTWLQNGKEVKSQNETYLVSTAARKQISASVKLERVGYQSSSIVLR